MLRRGWLACSPCAVKERAARAGPPGEVQDQCPRTAGESCRPRPRAHAHARMRHAANPVLRLNLNVANPVLIIRSLIIRILKTGAGPNATACGGADGGQRCPAGVRFVFPVRRARLREPMRLSFNAGAIPLNERTRVRTRNAKFVYVYSLAFLISYSAAMKAYQARR